MKETNLSIKEKVLASVDRLSGRGDRLHGPTLDDVKKDLKQRYGTDLTVTDRHLRGVLSDLKEEDYIESERRVLSDKRKAVISMTTKGERIVLSLIKFGKEKGLVHDGWEGLVEDPPDDESGQGFQRGEEPDEKEAELDDLFPRVRNRKLFPRLENRAFLPRLRKLVEATF